MLYEKTVGFTSLKDRLYWKDYIEHLEIYSSVSTAALFCSLSRVCVYYCEFTNSKQYSRHMISSITSHSMVLICGPFKKQFTVFESMAFMKRYYAQYNYSNN